MSERAAFYTTRELAELFNVCPRTIHRWIARGLIAPRIQYRGGTHLRFIFPCSEAVKLLNSLPTPRTVGDPRMLKLLELRRLYVRKATAARRKAKAQAEIVNPGAN